MKKILHLIVPFFKHACCLGVLVNIAILFLFIGGSEIFNVPTRIVFFLLVVMSVVVNLIFFPVYTKGYFCSNLSWLVDLPLKRRTLISSNVLFSLSTFLFGVLLFMTTVTIGDLFLTESGADSWSWGEIFYELFGGHLDLSRSFLGVNLSFCLITLFLFSSYLILMYPSQMNGLAYGRSLNARLFSRKSNVPNIPDYIVIPLIIFVVLIFFAFADSRVRSPMNTYFVLGLILPLSWMITTRSLADESHFSKRVFKAFLSLVVIGSIVTSFKAYHDAKNSNLSLYDRVEAYNHMGHLAPPVEIELMRLIKEAGEDESDLDIQNIVASSGDGKIHVFNQLIHAPYTHSRRKQLEKLKDDVGKLAPDELELSQLFHERDSSAKFRRKLEFIDLTKLEFLQVSSLGEYVSERTGRADTHLCQLLSQRSYSKVELSKLLKSSHVQNQVCGLIYARYYPEYDLRAEIVELARRDDVELMESLFITASVLSARRFSVTELTSLGVPDLKAIEVDCPENGEEYLESFEELSFAQHMQCPRKYVERTPYESTGLDTLRYVKYPQKKFCKCLEEHLKKE